MEILWTVFEKFEIFMKSSGEKKRLDCISCRKFFPTPKNFNQIIAQIMPATRERKMKLSKPSQVELFPILEQRQTCIFSKLANRAFGKKFHNPKKGVLSLQNASHMPKTIMKLKRVPFDPE